MGKRKQTGYAMSRRRQRILFVAFLLAAVILIALDQSPVSRSWRPEPDDVGKYHDKNFRVLKVVDGDTIDIDVPDGKYEHTRIRLWGIDTPEKNAFFGDRATSFARELVLGKEVTVYVDQDNRTRGKYGRLLAYVQLPDGRFLNEVLVSEGLAYADLRFGHSFYNKYRQLEGSARSQGKGLWAQVSRQQLPDWLQRKRPKLLLK